MAEDRSSLRPSASQPASAQSRTLEAAESPAEAGDTGQAILDLLSRIAALEAANMDLLSELSAFAVFGGENAAGLDDETVIRLTYDDREWGDDTVLGEIFLRPFRRARALFYGER